MTLDFQRDVAPFLKEYARIGRGPLEARCLAAEVKLRAVRAALEAGDVARAAELVNAILPRVNP
jgi:hypothetical protein